MKASLGPLEGSFEEQRAERCGFADAVGEEEGECAPLVLVHGTPTCPALWRHVVPRITGARCLAWEMVGYGGSIPEERSREIFDRAAGELFARLDEDDRHRAGRVCGS
jgi:pimeloyl-ACP methyl ester carboxylesterase